MKASGSIAEVRWALDEVRREGATVGLVPTMGYLHEGHLSLMAAARADTDFVVATIFVNPLQFAPGEDLASYPRDPDGDRAKAEAADVDLLFSPEHDEMYPDEVLTTVSVGGISQSMEGATRPTHFAGVATVVAKLFAIAGPCRAYFGEKDFQQLAVIRKMVADLSFPVEVIGCPIVREPDGLALSSRNAYLTPDQREAAPVLQRALKAGVAYGPGRRAGPVRGLHADRRDHRRRAGSRTGLRRAGGPRHARASRRGPRAGDLPTADRRPFRRPPPPGQHRPRGPGLTRQGSRQGRA